MPNRANQDINTESINECISELRSLNQKSCSERSAEQESRRNEILRDIHYLQTGLRGDDVVLPVASRDSTLNKIRDRMSSLRILGGHPLNSIENIERRKLTREINSLLKDYRFKRSF